MEQVVRKFRTSLGGFNRRDVMSYIEEMYAAHSKQVDALEAELAETRNHRESLEGELAGLKDEKGSVAAEEANAQPGAGRTEPGGEQTGGGPRRVGSTSRTGRPTGANGPKI